MKPLPITFCLAGMLEFEGPTAHGKLRVDEGSTIIVSSFKSYVLLGTNGPVEVADLTMLDGTVSKAVPYDVFRFEDN